MGTKAIPALCGAIDSRNELVSKNAVIILGWIGDVSAVPALIEKLRCGRKGGFLDLRANIVTTLGKIGSESAIAILMDIVKDRRENEYTVRDAIWSLGEIGSRTPVSMLIEQLPRQPRETQAVTVTVLGILGDAAALPMLSKLLADPDPAVVDSGGHAGRKPMCQFAVDALIQIGTDAAFKILEIGKHISMDELHVGFQEWRILVN